MLKGFLFGVFNRMSECNKVIEDSSYNINSHFVDSHGHHKRQKKNRKDCNIVMKSKNEMRKHENLHIKANLLSKQLINKLNINLKSKKLAKNQNKIIENNNGSKGVRSE